jgi:hypothetical protein
LLDPRVLFSQPYFFLRSEGSQKDTTASSPVDHALGSCGSVYDQSSAFCSAG